MTLERDERRCIGYGTEQGQPDADCLDCERRTQGIADYKDGLALKVMWLTVPTKQPCEERMEKQK